VLSPQMKFPLKLLSNLAWRGEESWSPNGKRGVHCRPAAPQLLREDSLAPSGASPAAHSTISHPSPGPEHAFSLGHATQCLFVKPVSCVDESALCLTVSNQFLQVIPNYMLLVTAHKKLMKPLPSIKCNFCVPRGKRGEQEAKRPNFPLAAAWLWGMASPSCPRFERSGAVGTTLCANYAACNGGEKDVR